MYSDSTENRLVRNRIDGGSEGIAFADARRNVISHNTLTSSGFGAITIVMYSPSDENVIKDNAMPSNGISILGDGNRVERNNVQGRFGYLDQPVIAILSGDANLVLRNRVAGDFDGFTIDGDADGILVAPAATATLIQGNLTVDAVDDGIDVDAPGTVVRSNTANDNGDLGIEAVEGVIDGGGNRASGNGNPLQCLNVVCR